MEIGFVDDCETELLRSQYFPSKVGGRPAWLELTDLPSTESLCCNGCEEPLVFLLQVYTGCLFNDNDAFHRALFVFCCRNGGCHLGGRSSGFKVFRSQLPRDNQYYLMDPPDDQDSDAPLKEGFEVPTLCDVCGCPGKKTCSACHLVYYCSKSHQVWDWTNGHKIVCKNGGIKPLDAPSPLLFPELELILDSEAEAIKEDQAKDAKTEEEKLEEFQALMTGLKDKLSTTDDVDDNDFGKPDPLVVRFRQRIRHEPSQVFRYHKGGKPLWIGSRQPKEEEDDIPLCHCGKPRQFECQIMPQLISHLKVENSLEKRSIDWGVLAVYSCPDSCDCGKGYVEECIWHNRVDD